VVLIPWLVDDPVERENSELWLINDVQEEKKGRDQSLQTARSGGLNMRSASVKRRRDQGLPRKKGPGASITLR